MRPILLALVMGSVVLAATPAALANQAAGYGQNCGYAAGPTGANVGGNELYVYALTTGSTGNAGTTTAGVCANFPGGPGTFEGGTAEVGVDQARGEYAVLDGNNNNGITPSAGYVALSNYEDGSPDPTPCNGNDNDGSAGSTNGGGCLGTKPPLPPVNLPFPLVACGDTSGPDWNSTQRDGCFDSGGGGIEVPPDLQLDDDGPPPTEPSAWCKAQGATGVAHHSLGTVDLWTYVLQSSGKAYVCVRAEAGSEIAGGRLEIDPAGSPGVAPVIDTSQTDVSTVCPQEVDQNGSVDHISISPVGANPVHICITVLGITKRIDVGTTSTTTSPYVRWVADNGSLVPSAQFP
jgi:hypothetical protein